MICQEIYKRQNGLFRAVDSSVVDFILFVISNNQIENKKWLF